VGKESLAIEQQTSTSTLSQSQLKDYQMAHSNRDLRSNNYISKIKVKVTNPILLKKLGWKKGRWTTVTMEPVFEAFVLAVFSEDSIKTVIHDLIDKNKIKTFEDARDLNDRSFSRFVHSLLIKEIAKKLNMKQKFEQKFELVKSKMMSSTQKHPTNLLDLI